MFFLLDQTMFLLFLRWKEAKIKTAPARAKTPAPRLNGNELASLKQISVLIAFVQGFLNARSDEVGSSFAARLRHRLFSRGCTSLFGRGEALLRSKQPGSMRCRRRARKKGDAESEPRKGLASAEGALKKYGGKPEKRKAVWAQRVLSARLRVWFLVPAASALIFLILFYQEKRIY